MPELTVKDINEREDLQLISDWQETEDIKNTFPKATQYDSFFVKIGDGDYTEIYGIVGIVPYLYKPIEKIL